MEEALRHDPQIFPVNLLKLGLQGEEAVKAPLTSWEFCQTGPEKDLNLRNLKTGRTLHFDQGVIHETLYWLLMYPLEDYDLAIVYGLGLGYYYQAMLPWLRQNPQRRILFIEDDPELLHAFLETNYAALLLADPQVILSYQGEFSQWTSKILEHLKNCFILNRKFCPSLYYLKTKAKEAHSLQFQIDYWIQCLQSSEGEYLQLGSIVLPNFFKNFMRLHRSKPGSFLKNRFTGVPAIICGAGPSLHKQKDLLRAVKDRTLIFAGGSAMNAINALGVIPHFGAGIDPHEAQLSRVLENNAWMVPYFFCTRMYAQALQALLGDLLYVAGDTAYPITDWLERKIGYKADEKLDHGLNVINMTVSIARYLGCNPILIAGVDLAYTEGMSYSEGVQVHGTYEPLDQLKTKSDIDELINATDIYGNPTQTLMKWLMESSWYNDIYQKNPNTILVNCTEGGIGLGNVPNRALNEVLSELKGEEDVQSLVDLNLSLIEDAPSPEFDDLYSQMLRFHQELDEVLNLISNQPDEEVERICDEKIKSSESLELLLRPFINLVPSEKLAPTQFHSPKDSLLPSRAAIMRYVIHKAASLSFMALNESAVEEVAISKTGLKSDMIPQDEGVYRFHDGVLELIDPRFGLNVHETLQDQPFDEETQTGFKEVHSELGELVERSYYFKGMRQGPSMRYADKGALITESWFLSGKREGMQKTYFSNGEVYAFKGYQKGVEQGVHRYYFRNRGLRAEISFKNGLLDGECRIFYENGQLKRSISYANGLRNGLDLYYQWNGRPLSEACYLDQKPYGIAKTWYPSGRLEKEIRYFVPGVIFEALHFDENGERNLQKERSSNYYEVLVRKGEHLQQTMQKLANNLEHAFLPKSAEEQADFKGLNDELAKLKDLADVMKAESGLDAGNYKESQWKSPSAKEAIARTVGELAGPMAQEMEVIHEQLKKLQERLKREDS